MEKQSVFRKYNVSYTVDLRIKDLMCIKTVINNNS